MGSIESSYGDSSGSGNPFTGDLDSSGNEEPNVGGVQGLVNSNGTYVSRDQVQKQLQRQMLIEGETEVNEAMINERNSAMRKINRDLHEVREIFSDLAVMVEDQDEAIGKSHLKLSRGFFFVDFCLIQIIFPPLF